MLRYKTETRPGLIALYDIRPGNGAGPFLQPRSPHGAQNWGALGHRLVAVGALPTHTNMLLPRVILLSLVILGPTTLTPQFITACTVVQASV